MYFQPRIHSFTPFSSTPAGQPEPVVVAGAGPVGLATALGLARRGVPVTVVEAGDSVSHGSRAICLSRHSLEILERLGVGDEFTRRSLPWTTGRSHYRDTEVLAFDMPRDEGDARPPMVNISQSVAETILVEAVEATEGCRVLRHSRVVGCRQDDTDDQVAVTVETPDGPRELRSRWLVAADGARSAVRQSLGLRLKGNSYEGRYVIADIHWESALPTERRVWFDPPSNPGSTIILHRQPDDIWRVDYQLRPGEDPEREIDEERIRARIARHLDWLGNDRPWTLEWASIYRAHALSLDTYRHGRVLFAGDAAHLVPIFGVRGLNSGLEDADVLAWALAAVERAEAGQGLLDTWAEERRDAWEQNVGQAEKSTLFMTPPTAGYEMTRDAVLSLALRRPVLTHLINPRQSSATHSRTSALTLPRLPRETGPDGPPGLLPGDPLRDRTVHVTGRPTSLNALRGGDFALLALHTDPAAVHRAAAALNVALRRALTVRALVASDGTRTPADGSEVTVLDDPGRALAPALGVHDGDVLLVRPDGLVLARFPDVSALDDTDGLARHLLNGGAR